MFADIQLGRIPMDAHRLAEIGRTVLHELVRIAYDIDAITIDLARLLPKGKVWRWQIEAILPLTLSATMEQSRNISLLDKPNDRREVAKKYIRALEFVVKAQETVAACNTIIARWNHKLPWMIASTEEIHEALCRFPDIVIPEDLRRYAPI